ncbi:MAG: hypothetical protein KatS3mg081_0334 [Gemmatimonadales bacterium]|nr:MAG: hypothetical protein KatS3mg081_0334 [Gemmatimonadales bacterium]
MDTQSLIQIAGKVAVTCVLVAFLGAEGAAGQSCGECEAWLNEMGHVVHAFEHQGPIHTCCPTSCHKVQAFWFCGYYHCEGCSPCSCWFCSGCDEGDRAYTLRKLREALKQRSTILAKGYLAKFGEQGTYFLDGSTVEIADCTGTILARFPVPSVMVPHLTRDER